MNSIAFPGRLSREDPDLSDRQRDVFRVLVGMYGRTARPVGSESLAVDAGIPLSPASIRTALAELESLGLLERAHASAGRVPTARGYEFYVRGLLIPAELPDWALDQIDRTLQSSARDVEALLQEASRVLSTLTQQLGLAVAQTLDADRLEGIDLEPLGDRRVLMALGLGDGGARTLVLELASPLDPAELGEVEDVLRERLTGLGIAEVRRVLAEDRDLIRSTAVRLVVRAATESWTRGVATPLLSAGTSHIAEQPEFHTAEQLRPVLRAVESGSPLDRLLVFGIEGQTGARVGLAGSPGLAGCSLVSVTLPGQVRAAVGVLGPVRMNYAVAFAAVDLVGARVAELLQA